MEARPEDVELELRWDGSGSGLAGELVVVNVSSHDVRLSGKPRLMPLGLGGESLGVVQVSTLESRSPGWIELSPGSRARSKVRWSGWSGTTASAQVLITLHGGQVLVEAVGLSQPSSADGPQHLSSSWFEPIE